MQLTVIDVKAELMVGKNIFILVHVFHRDHCNWKWFSLQLNGKIIFSWNGKIIWSAQTYIDNIYISATSLDLEYPPNSGFCHKNNPKKHSSLPFCTYWPFNGRLESVLCFMSSQHGGNFTDGQKRQIVGKDQQLSCTFYLPLVKKTNRSKKTCRQLRRLVLGSRDGEDASDVELGLLRWLEFWQLVLTMRMMMIMLTKMMMMTIIKPLSCPQLWQLVKTYLNLRI